MHPSSGLPLFDAPAQGKVARFCLARLPATCRRREIQAAFQKPMFSMGQPGIHHGKAVMHCELLHDYSSGFSLVCATARCFSHCGSASSEFRCLFIRTEGGAYGDRELKIRRPCRQCIWLRPRTFKMEYLHIFRASSNST